MRNLPALGSHWRVGWFRWPCQGNRHHLAARLVEVRSQTAKVAQGARYKLVRELLAECPLL